MNQKQFNQARQQLENEKQQLMSFIQETDAAGLGLSLSDYIEELSTYDQHPADVASEVFERSKDFALRENAMTEIRDVNQALEKLQAGTYSVCDVCGGTIPQERLEALPSTSLCVDCSRREQELDQRGSVRPVEEEVMQRSLARAFDDSDHKNMYDGEDTWQDLARWQEHAPDAGAGSYYGGDDAAEEPRGYTEEIDQVAYQRGDDGMIYETTRGLDDESTPQLR